MSDPRGEALRRGYDGIAGAYREALFDELAGKPLDRAFLQALAERCGDGPMLEVGCGPGQVSRFLASLGAAVEGVDLSPAMVAEARRAVPGVAFTEADFFALPHTTGSVRAVVGFYAIVHLDPADVPRAIAEFARVLAPGGLLALAFHAGDQRVHVDELFGRPTSLDFIWHQPAAVIAALEGAGFTLEARLDRAPYPEVEHPSQRCYLLARR